MTLTYAEIYRLYHILMMHMLKWISLLFMMFAIVAEFAYVVVLILHSSQGHYPWWAPLFILALGAAGFFTRKIAIRELRRSSLMK
jgi:hypothetical protein